MAERITFEARLNPAHHPELVSLTIEGDACEVEGVELVVHPSIRTSKPELHDSLWSVSEPRTGCAIVFGHVSSDAAIEAAAGLIFFRGGAEAVERAVEEKLCSSPSPMHSEVGE